VVTLSCNRQIFQVRAVFVTLIVVMAGWVATAGAQRAGQPVDLSDGPAAVGFDLSRFSDIANGLFETFHVEETEPLSRALASEQVSDKTVVLVIETAAGRVALLRDQMAYHHIAQGAAGGKDWLATF
jgi:hypothetical protein